MIQSDINFWVVTHSEKIAMSTLPRCASTSLKHTCAFYFSPWTNGKISDILTRVTWLRNPLERLKSVFFYRGEQNWKQFVDKILTSSDELWNPQVEMLTCDGVYLPTHVERFEDLPIKFKSYIDVDLPHRNASKKFELEVYREADIEDKYAEDFKMWRSLQ
ncbi:MAG: hypothetical protein E2O82_05050 [Betaproteobacteria bacterium]|nr:MAG: hypothetical protein E2O82_05050 [Betaproteobacteria bacterium]